MGDKKLTVGVRLLGGGLEKLNPARTIDTHALDTHTHTHTHTVIAICDDGSPQTPP